MDEDKKKKLLILGVGEIIIISVAILVILGILAFLKVFPLPQLSSFNPKPSSPKVTLSPATPVEIACPVAFTLCRDAVKSTYQNQPAILYTAKSGDQLFGMGEITSYLTVSTTLENKKAKTIYTSFIHDDKCYSVTYVVPESTVLKKISQLPLRKGTTLATLTGDKLLLNNKEFSMLLQLQAKDLNFQDKNKPDYLKCTVLNKQPREYGNYITPDVNSFD